MHRGRGEAAGVYYLKDDAEHIVATLESKRAAIEAGIDREHSCSRCCRPAARATRSTARCGSWSPGAAASRCGNWQDWTPPKPLLTTFTLGAETPAHMADGARRYAIARALKLKLTGEAALDMERVRAVRAARPDAWIGVDANQGYTIEAAASR